MLLYEVMFCTVLLVLIFIISQEYISAGSIFCYIVLLIAPLQNKYIEAIKSYLCKSINYILSQSNKNTWKEKLTIKDGVDKYAFEHFLKGRTMFMLL